MPTLEWIGKSKVINHHLDVPYRVLEEKYTFNKDSPSENKIIHGDNLAALKSLLPEYEGKINCIYIDPPYNTGEESWVYNDNVNDPKIKKWIGEVVGKEGEDLSRHDKWLCMMYPRLKLLHQLLADSGVLFISIDDNEQENLKLICDEIFGTNNYIATIIWQKRNGGGNDSSFIAVDHEYVLIYASNKTSHTKKWRIAYSQEYLKRYDKCDDIGRFYYDTLSRPGLKNPIIYDVVCPDGSIIKNGTWQVSKKTFDKKILSGDICFTQNKKGGYTVMRKVRLPKGKVFRSIYSQVSNKNAADEMDEIFNNKKYFPTPKPQNLINSLLSLVTDNNSIILDSFAGSGTTAHAVLNLNKTDGGNRKFILIEMEDYAEKTTAERMRHVINGYVAKKSHEIILYDEKITLENLENGSPLIEKANEIYNRAKENGDDVSKPKITDGKLQVIKTVKKNEIIEGTGGDFTYYELGDVVLHPDKTLNENLPREKIEEYIWITETHTPYIKQNEQYYLGTENSTAYYFCYERENSTTLDYDLLSQIHVNADFYVIYADTCMLSEEELMKYNITFKKIPRDITTF